MTIVQLEVHIETAGTPLHNTWWGSTDSVPGYFASAETLHELKNQVTNALKDILGEDVEIQLEISDPFSSLTDRPFVQSADDESKSLGSNPTESEQELVLS